MLTLPILVVVSPILDPRNKVGIRNGRYISDATAKYFDWTSSVPTKQEKPIDLKASLDTLSTGKSIPRYSVVKTILHSAPLFLEVSGQFEEDACAYLCNCSSFQ